jgi:hypothetical protein
MNKMFYLYFAPFHKCFKISSEHKEARPLLEGPRAFQLTISAATISFANM